VVALVEADRDPALARVLALALAPATQDPPVPGIRARQALAHQVRDRRMTMAAADLEATGRDAETIARARYRNARTVLMMVAGASASATAAMNSSIPRAASLSVVSPKIAMSNGSAERNSE